MDHDETSDAELSFDQKGEDSMVAMMNDSGDERRMGFTEMYDESADFLIITFPELLHFITLYFSKIRGPSTVH